MRKIFPAIALVSLLFNACKAMPLTTQITKTPTEIPLPSETPSSTQRDLDTPPTAEPSPTPAPVTVLELGNPVIPAIQTKNYVVLTGESVFDLEAGSNISIPIGILEIEEEDPEGENAEVLLIDENTPSADIIFGIDVQEKEIVLQATNPEVVLLQNEGDVGFESCLKMIAEAENSEAYSVDDIRNGDTYCILTGEGNTGMIQIEENFSNPEADFTPSLAITYSLWRENGDLYPNQAALLAIRSTIQQTTTDLDFAVNDRMQDLELLFPNEEQVQFVPLGSARLAYWGNDSIPRVEDCSSLSLGNDPLNFGLNPQKPVFLCYQTNEGRLGRMAYQGFEILVEEEISLNDINLAAETWGFYDSLPFSPEPEESYNRVVLPIGSGFDAETASVIAPVQVQDFLFEDDQSGQAALVPNPWAEGSKLGVWGNTLPAYNDCLTGSLSTYSILLNEISTGDFICLETDSGQMGFMRLENVRANEITLTVVLWGQEGSQYQFASPITNVVHGFEIEGVVNLDQGDSGADISFRYDDGWVALLAEGTASLTYWGNSFPTYQECSSVPTEIGPYLVSTDSNDPAYFCYVTDEGNRGRLVYLERVGGLFLFDAETWSGK